MELLPKWTMASFMLPEPRSPQYTGAFTRIRTPVAADQTFTGCSPAPPCLDLNRRGAGCGEAQPPIGKPCGDRAPLLPPLTTVCFQSTWQPSVVAFSFACCAAPSVLPCTMDFPRPPIATAP